ncbi:hypothetical protein QFC24_003230 [Naganishia onofrii]|uniref:Uncharacterized protein n=1 Tax=Naganishia onofrii TaxID=1851511 RepID=A0ACC2XP14_9TREE|nr:hypothetical protein QFC24_003230 [Naganishia onofrii]
MGSAKSPNFSLGKPPNKSPSSENVTGSADEKSDLDQASRRTKYGWQSPRYAVEDGYSGEKLLVNGGQSRHRKTTSHTRKVSISSGFAGLGSGRRVDAAAFLDESTDTEDDDDGVKSTKKVEVHDRRAEVSAGLTGKDKHAFILLIVLYAWFSNRIGRRKSWIIPVQLTLGVGMWAVGSSIEGWLAAEEVDVRFLTAIFVTFIFFAATQDIAVDGWALTLLSPANLSYASTAQTIGLAVGYTMSFTVFLALNSVEFCNRWLRAMPMDVPLVSLGGYLKFWAGVFVAFTVWLILGKKEDATSENDPDMDVKKVYKVMWSIVRLKNIQSFIILHLVSKIGFQIQEVTPLKLIEKGLPKEDLAFINLLNVPFELVGAWLAARWSRGNKPLDTWLQAFWARFLVGGIATALVWAFPSDGKVHSAYFFGVVAVTLMASFASTVQFVGMTAYHTSIADIRIGGTYMTLLNTVSNLGGTWPKHIAINKPPKDQPIQDDFHNTLSDSWLNMSDCPSAKESPPHGADSAATKEGDSTSGVTHTQSDSPITAKEEPLEFDHEGDGDSEDKGDNVEGSIKRPRLRLSQAYGEKSAAIHNSLVDLVRDETDPKRMHRKGSTSNLRNAVEGSTLPLLNTFEARLGSLEALLRDVPPDVHNALISRLDASLNAVPAEGSTLKRSNTTGLNDTRRNTARMISKMPERSLASGLEDIQRSLQGLNLSNGYLYLDEIGQTKWQGATSGFPLLDLLTAAAANNGNTTSDAILEGIEPGNTRKTSNPYAEWPANPASRTGTPNSTGSADSPDSPNDVGIADGEKKKQERFFPGRDPRPSQMLNPEATWRVITNVIPSDLMDTLVRCYLSTSHLLWPFLHVPSFLADYANPQKWAEPGFACFVVAVCTLSSRHVDDPRVRAKIDDPSTAGKQYFELFKRLRDLPSADRPTLYSIQAAFLAAIFAFGLGTLSKAFSLLAESVTLCLDGGLHRSVEGYEYFNPIEQETRKRTFWSIYSWDKQSAALFGRPPIIHLRDCDVPEPLQVDDEFITKDEILPQPSGHQTRMSAFVAVIRLHVVLEANSLTEEEALLEEWVSLLPKHWHYDAETVESKDPIRITQAERLHCLEHLVRMIVYRHRFSGFVQIPAATDAERARHLYYCKKAMDSALTICANHVHIVSLSAMDFVHSLPYLRK